MKTTILGLTAAATALVAIPLAAQDPAQQAAGESAQETDAYSEAVSAFASEEIEQLVFERDLQIGFISTLKSDPELLEGDADCPGLINGYVQAVSPTLRSSHSNDYDWYRAQLLSILQSGMTEDQARGVTELFGSAIGQRVLAAAIANTAATNTLNDIMANDDASVSRESLEADKRATAMRTIEALGQEDSQNFVGAMAKADWFPAFTKMQPAIQELRFELANRDFTAEEDAEFDQITDEYFETEYDKCYGEE